MNDKDELLRTPQDVDSEDEVDRDEVPTDERVSENFNSSFEKLVSKVMNQVGSISMICDNELAKTMRTDDPTRDSIVSAVAEQTALVKEILLIMLADMHKWYKPQIDEGITPILRRARLHRAEALS